jgi:hypothetical protein
MGSSVPASLHMLQRKRQPTVPVIRKFVVASPDLDRSVKRLSFPSLRERREIFGLAQLNVSVRYWSAS